jgi:predicted nucleic acid-binding protein
MANLNGVFRCNLKITVWTRPGIIASYVVEAHSLAAEGLMGQFASSLLVCPLQELEVANAFELAVFREQMTRAQADAARSDFESDLHHWNLTDLPFRVFTRAVEVARRLTAKYGARSLDALHVAAALVLGAEVFITFDKRQELLARASGLKVH